VSTALKDPVRKNNPDYMDIIITLGVAKKASTGFGASTR
jgi:hypothetical protein